MAALRRLLTDRGRTVPPDLRHDAPLSAIVVDSLDLVTVLVEFEQAGARLPEHLFPHLVTVGDLAQLLAVGLRDR